MTTICLFRRDLRLTDNPALTAAAAEGPVTAVLWVDAVLRAEGAASRWRLGEAARALDAGLDAAGGGLWVLEGDAGAVADLARATGARAVHANAWPEPARAAADAALGRRLAEIGVPLTLHHAHALLPPGQVTTGKGEAFKVFTPFARAARRAGIAPPLPRPPRLDQAPAPAGLARASAVALAPDMRRGAAVVARSAPAAGEDHALRRLAGFLGRLADYPAKRDRMDAPDAGSGLSDALAAGEISPRSIWAAAEAWRQDAPGLAAAAEKLQSELLWRDFAWSLLGAAPDLPTTPWKAGFEGFPFREAPAELRAWQRGMTGETLVDAGMRELYTTGRMHNRVRMVAASYLTKHLLIDWREGLRWFADTLIDWDPASNAMNWQWVAGSGPDAAPFFRIFNPQTQADKFDPQGLYRRRWLLGWQGADEAPARAFFEAVPRSWGLSPDRPYPTQPIVSLAEGRRRALAALARLSGEGVA